MKKFIISVIICFLLLNFTSCGLIEFSDSDNEYSVAVNKLKERHPKLYEYLPKLENTEEIKNFYIYAEDDLLDSFYIMYVDSICSDEVYESEQNRLLSKYQEESCSSEEFDDNFDFIIPLHNFIEFDHVDNTYPLSSGMANCEYILFNKSGKQIVYVFIFTKDLMDEHLYNIPETYLPKELIELRDTYISNKGDINIRQ